MNHYRSSTGFFVKIFLVCSTALFMIACSSSKKAHKSTPVTGKLGSYGKTNTGQASYYASKFDGRKTASGETFDNSALTAAHRTLAFGTLVKVTNVSNGKSVIVRINDRGPWSGGRIIDLSQAAAQKIDMMKAGVIKVKIEY